MDRRHLEVFLEAAAISWGRWEATPEIDDRTQGLVREPGGVGQLWQAGIHVADIQVLAAVAAAVDEPLPVRFYLGLVYGNAEPRWVTEVLDYQPDPDVAGWLVWLDEPHKAGTPRQWGAWLTLGLSKSDVVAAIKGRLSADYVHAVASANDLSPRALAAQLVKWTDAGCSPGLKHFHALEQYRVYSPTPSARAIDALLEQLDAGQHQSPDRTELAVLLEILGNRGEVLRALNHGVRTVDDLDTYVTSDEQPTRQQEDIG